MTLTSGFILVGFVVGAMIGGVLAAWIWSRRLAANCIWCGKYRPIQPAHVYCDECVGKFADEVLSGRLEVISKGKPRKRPNEAN